MYVEINLFIIIILFAINVVMVNRLAAMINRLDTIDKRLDIIEKILAAQLEIYSGST